MCDGCRPYKQFHEGDRRNCSDARMQMFMYENKKKKKKKRYRAKLTSIIRQRFEAPSIFSFHPSSDQLRRHNFLMNKHAIIMHMVGWMLLLSYEQPFCRYNFIFETYSGPSEAICTFKQAAMLFTLTPLRYWSSTVSFHRILNNSH